ncbi:N-acetylglucosamine kinase [Actinoallomurus sp. CA-142502]|uniref:N-acetylglucosamine kinase n=1 Tax=Actinoallomurus sp. CA-142502 TaxID=3239885 RepID=UPI003D90F850
MQIYLLVDVGQTGTRVRITRPSGGNLDDAAGGVRAAEDPERHLARVVTDALRRHGSPVDQVAAGLSGLQGTRGRPRALLEEWSAFGTRRVVLADDSVTAYLAALGDRPGVVVSVGTGVVALATGVRGGWARIDGWGPLLGDSGGAYWIGRAGLETALRAFDGRGAATALLDAAAEAFGDPALLAGTLQRDPDRVARIAGFARQVLGLAERGDPDAGRITVDAAGHLADTVMTAAARVGDDETITASWSGSVLAGSRALRDAFASALPSRCRLVPPAASPLDGARLLIDLPSSHPLTALTSEAST